jgi:hypothetical protein
MNFLVFRFVGDRETELPDSIPVAYRSSRGAFMAAYWYRREERRGSMRVELCYGP